MAITNALLPIFGIFSWRMLEERKLFVQDFRAAPAWIISFWHMESVHGALPGFSIWRDLANSFRKKSPEIHLWADAGILQSSDTSLSTSLVNARSFVLYVPLVTSCEATELAEMGQGRWDCLVLPVRLLMAFHASRLECVKSMALTASDQRFLRLLSSLASKAEAAVLEPSPCGARRNAW